MFACKEYALFSFARDEWLDKYTAVGVGSRSCKANDFQVSRSIQSSGEVSLTEEVLYQTDLITTARAKTVWHKEDVQEGH